VFTTRRYTNTRLPLPLPLLNTESTQLCVLLYCQVNMNIPVSLSL